MRDEIERALYGAWQLSRFNAAGLMAFDLSVNGFWRSFWAAPLGLPIFLLFVLVRVRTAPAELDTGPYVTAQLVTYGVLWLVFPLLALILTRLAGLTQRYVPLVVASNWVSLIHLTLQVAVGLLTLRMSLEGQAFFQLVILSGIIAMRWFATKVALVTSGGIAFAFVIADFLVGLLVSEWCLQLLAPDVPVVGDPG